ncbi:hypothetical protein R3P38DRAFT_2952170 [Favolaschia claudopus]|uniref:Uncharacterized protein n=1 Tax=Favolaschia claudopus TaxID=2862362 RepID=A0AAW0BGM9_9AGAR
MPIVPGTRESYIGVFLENIIYGVYLSVFVECLRLVANRKARGAKHIYLVATTLIMFILITMRCVIDTYRCVVAFDGADLNWGAPNSPLGILTNLCWVLVTPVADIFIVFRTVIVLPALLSLANLGRNSPFVLARNMNSAISGTKIALNAFMSLSLCTMFFMDGCLTTRRPSEHLRVLSVLVESAAIYTLLLIAIMIVDQSFVSFILINCASPTIVRSSRGTSYGENSITATNVSSIAVRANTSTWRQSYVTSPGDHSEVQINLEQTTSGAIDLQRDDASAQEAAKMV